MPGHVPSVEGISASPEEMEKVQNLLIPTNAKELDSFLGLASCYRQFIPKFATMAKCMHQHISLIDEKRSKSFEMQTDASLSGLDAVDSKRPK